MTVIKNLNSETGTKYHTCILIIYCTCDISKLAFTQEENNVYHKCTVHTIVCFCVYTVQHIHVHKDKKHIFFSYLHLPHLNLRLFLTSRGGNQEIFPVPRGAKHNLIFCLTWS